jgi:hypothetical protein
MKVEEVDEEEEEVEEDGGMNQEDQNLEEVTPIDGRH